MKRIVILFVCLFSMIGYSNLSLCQDNSTPIIVLNFSDANSRDNYFTMHNIKAAHNVSKGAGVKIGILDWGFAYEDHKELYAGGCNYSSSSYNYEHVAEHGYWMANTLKEIAPECEVFALGSFIPDDEDKWVDALIKSINWAMENQIDILTLSHQKISDKNRARFDEIINKAIKSGIVTTFIHYDNPNNILPYPILAQKSPYNRDADVNIFQYDYSVLFVHLYLEYLKWGIEKSGYIPYLSYSSMSPVTAGFVAILKSINNSLSPAEYKEILVKTSSELYYKDYNYSIEGNVKNVVDIGKAVEYLQNNY